MKWGTFCLAAAARRKELSGAIMIVYNTTLTLSFVLVEKGKNGLPG